MKANIRSATSNDIEEIIRLCADHAEFEQCEYSNHDKSAKLSDALLGKNPKLYCLIAENEDGIIGYATYMLQYSTWDAEEYIYMDCLYLDEQCRGQNIGEQLINEIKSFGRSHGLSHIQWQTPGFNKRAIKFYNRLGSTSKLKERFFLDCE